MFWSSTYKIESNVNGYVAELSTISVIASKAEMRYIKGRSPKFNEKTHNGFFESALQKLNKFQPNFFGEFPVQIYNFC